ncbi:MAG: Holliday junction branch migration protein RuvA [Bacillota bacterium]
MISFIRGKVAAVNQESVIVDVHGIGYEVLVPMAVLSQLPAMGHEVHLHTHFYVREDMMQLFGFLELPQLKIFRLLLEVSGVGPRGALSALSALGAEQLAASILGEDILRLTTIPGVGKKTAQRMIIDLKDKLTKTWGYPVEVPVAWASRATDDALEVLLSLGFDRQETYSWLDRAKAIVGEEAGAEDYVRFILKEKGKVR